MGWRYDGYTGVWIDGPTGPEKIAAIGIRVNTKGISSHGFALNANTNLAHFEGIIPCGIADHGVTSMSRLLGREITIQDVLPQITESFAAVFGYDPQLEGTGYVHH